MGAKAPQPMPDEWRDYDAKLRQARQQCGNVVPTKPTQDKAEDDLASLGDNIALVVGFMAGTMTGMVITALIFHLCGR